MGIVIKKLPDYEVAYIRHVGSYFEPSNHWGRLGEWAASNGLFPPTQKYIGLSLDNPEFVAPELCRHDACITLSKDFVKEEQSEIQFKTITGGLYALYQFYDTPDKLANAYQAVFGDWIPQSDYVADDKISLEFSLNNPLDDIEGKCKVDLYVPIKKKLSKDEVITEFEQAQDWVNSLKKHPEKDFFEPIENGKWSVAEIIAHLAFWDKYVLEAILPNMKQNTDIKSIDFQELNDQASNYALSGISGKSLINQFVEGRKSLVTELRNKTDSEFYVQFKINGDEVDPYSGAPFSMYSYISSFIWHDNHHKKQIIEFFNSKYAEDFQVK